MLKEFAKLSPADYEYRMRLISQKPIITKREAAEYFHIGVTKMEKLLSVDSEFRIINGNKYLVKREAFEEYIAKTGRI